MSVSKYTKGVVNLVQDELQSIEMMMMTMIAVMTTLFSLHATCADANLEYIVYEGAGFWDAQPCSQIHYSSKPRFSMKV